MKQKIRIDKNQISYRQEILRKLIHLSSLWMVAAIYFLPKSIALIVFGFLFLGNVLVEYAAYRNWPFLTPVFNVLFSKMMRSTEKCQGFHLTGAPYVFAAAFLSTLFFPKIAAMFGLTVMLLSDTAAALIGRKFGVHKIEQLPKTVEGTIAFWTTGFAVLLIYRVAFALPDLSILWGIIGITLAMIAELYEKQIRIDDNFSIPMICGYFLMTSF